MNKCINCGCDDAYPSLPPCPTPPECPNPEPCAEVYDAQCIVLTIADITCGEDIVVNQNDSVVEALTNIVNYFCERLDTLTNYINSQLFVINNRLTTIEGNIVTINGQITNILVDIAAIDSALTDTVSSVTGLNTDNTDPQNPIVRISVDGTTITGLGTPASPLVASGGGGGTIGGSGTNNYVARWTPDGSTLGNSVITDSGTTIGIGTAPSAGQLVRALTTTQAVAYSITQAFSGSSKGIELVLSNGSGVCIGAEFAVRTNSSINVASLNEAGNNIYNFTSYIPANSNIGSIVMAQDANADNNYGLVSIVSLPSLTTNNHIGARFIVDNGVTNYGLQIEDGTEGVGKVLTCMTSDGKANWETTNKQKEITTSNYVLTNADNDYTIFINNGVTAISISLGAITVANFCVGFIQEGSADVTFVGVTNPVGLKLKGQGYQAFIERKLSTSTYYLLGNTKV